MHPGDGLIGVCTTLQPSKSHPERGSNLGFHIQYDVSECATDSDREEHVPCSGVSNLAQIKYFERGGGDPLCTPFPQEVGGGASGLRVFRRTRLFDSWH